MSDPLPPDFAAGLEATASRRGGLGNPVYYFTETGSTNDVAATLADQGAGHGTLVLASAQTAGRGRLGRQWHSPADAGLYASLVLRSPAAAPFMTLAGGVAIAEGITRATGLPVQIKWPNDIVSTDPARPARWRKLAGILAEASSNADGLVYVVLGFGINLRSTAYPAELRDRATSIETELGRDVDAAAVLVETLAALRTRLTALEAGQADTVLAAWSALAPSARGRAVMIPTASGRVEGTTSGIDETGALLVRVGGGVERVMAGEVEWT